MKLRPYQLKAITDVSARYREGHQGVLLVVPTGGGKTVIYSEIARFLSAGGASVLIIEPGVELVEQTRDKLIRLGVPRVGIIAAGWGDGYNPDPGALVQVATIQTIRSRPEAVNRSPSLIIFDEAHLAAANSYKLVRQRYPNAKRLGVTASPWRLDGESFLDLATAIVIGPTLPELQAFEALVRFRTRSIPLTSFADAKRRPGTEFNGKQMAEAYRDRTLVGDPIRHYMDSDKRGKTGILFAANVAHAYDLHKAAIAEGITCEVVHGETPLALRREILGTPERPGRLGTGETTLVANYGVLTAGFDCPRVEYVGIVRATASKSLWVQMGGRGLRPCPETGKEYCLIDDFGANARRHGNLGIRHEYSLEGLSKAERGDLELGKDCPQCKTVMDMSDKQCAHCGYEFPTIRKKPRQQPDQIDGQLVDVHDDELAFDLKALSYEDPAVKAERLRESRKKHFHNQARQLQRMMG